MRIELRGTIRAALATSAVDVQVPAAGIPLSQLLAAIAAAHPRAAGYLSAGTAGDALRVVVNGAVARPKDDPRIHPTDAVLIMHAISGGGDGARAASHRVASLSDRSRRGP